MRTINISIEQIIKWANNPEGVACVIPVIVNWPELQLTEKQRLANAIALVNGKPEPYEDHSLFNVEFRFEKRALK